MLPKDVQEDVFSSLLLMLSKKQILYDLMIMVRVPQPPRDDLTDNIQFCDLDVKIQERGGMDIRRRRKMSKTGNSGSMHNDRAQSVDSEFCSSHLGQCRPIAHTLLNSSGHRYITQWFDSDMRNQNHLQEVCQFKTFLGYVASSKMAWTTVLDSVTQKRKKKGKMSQAVASRQRTHSVYKKPFSPQHWECCQ